MNLETHRASTNQNSANLYALRSKSPWSNYWERSMSSRTL